MTHTCENITFPQLLLWAVMKYFSVSLAFDIMNFDLRSQFATKIATKSFSKAIQTMLSFLSKKLTEQNTSHADSWPHGADCSLIITVANPGFL